MAKVAIIIPTMNRPDYMLRKFRFYELMENPHTLYVQDSSNEENAKKLKDSIEQFNKKLNIVYQWVPPGNYVYQKLLPLIKEKYSFHMGDDDLIIPKTISECADFLEEHPDYATCAGKQVNIRFRKEDYNKSYGIIEKQTKPLNESIEDEDMLVRIKKFWLGAEKSSFICFAVRRIETEKIMRKATQHFGLLEDMYEFSQNSIFIALGKFKVLDKLGYIMQISNIRTFNHHLTEDLFLFPSASEQWGIYLEGFSEILRDRGMSEKESYITANRTFILFLYSQYSLESWPATDRKKSLSVQQNLFRKLRHFASNKPFIKKIYYKFNPPNNYVNLPESKYYNDFKLVKDFLENKKPII